MLNKKLQTIKKTLLLLSALAVISCSNITKTSDYNSNGTGPSTSQNSSEKAYLKLTVDKARTVLPDITGTNLRNLALTGVKTETDSNTTPKSQTLGTWDTLTDLQEATIPVSTGQWTFTLTAFCGGTKLEGTQEKTIIVGNNTLNFGLKITNAGNGTGALSITLDFSSATNSSNVNYAVATLENLDGSEVTDNNTIIIQSQTLTPSESKVTFTAGSIPAGTYRARIKMYANNPTVGVDDFEIASYRELVQISTGCTSSATRSIDSLDSIYTFNYELNGGSLPQGVTLQETYFTSKSTLSIDLPQLTRNHYDFGGWYTDSDFTAGNEITQITNTQKNIKVYAKFTPTVYTITYKLYGGINPTDAITEYNIESNFFELPFPQDGYDENRNFEYWYVWSENENKAILVDWYYLLDNPKNITLIAKWDKNIIKADAAIIADEIQNMHESGTIKAIGAFTNEDIRIINSAMKALYTSHSDILIKMDLSQVTGLTSLENASYQNHTYSFYNCQNLSEIILPDSITYIGEYAFYNCTGLTEITIPDSVTHIEEGAFLGCNSMTEITISPNLTHIAKEGAFSGPFNKVIYNGTLEQWISKKWCLGCTIENLYINGQKLTNLIIPENVTQIEEEAFFNCRGITEITLPGSITNIGQFAFCYCTSLTSLIIKEGVTHLGEDAFAECTSLTEITLPSSLTEIDRAAFGYCTSLTKINIPSNVTTIGYWAFSNCTSLTEITIPDNVTFIGLEAFKNCTSLTEITIPSNVTQIDEYAFNGCTGLTEITIPSSVTLIGRKAFEGCVLLNSVTFENSSNWYYTTDYNYTNGTEIDFSANTSDNATYLTTYEYVFYRTDEPPED